MGLECLQILTTLRGLLNLLRYGRKIFDKFIALVVLLACLSAFKVLIGHRPYCKVVKIFIYFYHNWHSIPQAHPLDAKIYLAWNEVKRTKMNHENKEQLIFLHFEVRCVGDWGIVRLKLDCLIKYSILYL